MGSKYHATHSLVNLWSPASWMRHPGIAAASVCLTGVLVLLSSAHFGSSSSSSLKKLRYPRAELRGTKMMDLWFQEHETQVRHSNEAETLGGASLVFLGDSITQGWQYGLAHAKLITIIAYTAVYPPPSHLSPCALHPKPLLPLSAKPV